MDRETLRLHVIQFTCANRCMGIDGNRGGCCYLGERDYIIGPIGDHAGFRQRMSERLGRPVTHAELFIDFEEGSALFPERRTWQDPKNFPALRFADEPFRPCRLYDPASGCTVHAIRPHTCRAFLCEPLRALVDNF